MPKPRMLHLVVKQATHRTLCGLPRPKPRFISKPEDHTCATCLLAFLRMLDAKPITQGFAINVPWPKAWEAKKPKAKRRGAK